MVQSREEPTPHGGLCTPHLASWHGARGKLCKLSPSSLLGFLQLPLCSRGGWPHSPREANIQALLRASSHALLQLHHAPSIWGPESPDLQSCLTGN